MSVDEVADSPAAQPCARGRGRRPACRPRGPGRSQTPRFAPADETAFGAPFWRAPARIDATLPDPDPARLDDDEFRNLADHMPILCWLARSDG